MSFFKKFTTMMFVVMSALVPLRAEAQDVDPARKNRNLGMGVILLGPTGLSTNYRLGRNSIDAAFAWNMNPGTTLYVHSTYLFRYPGFFKVDNVPFLFFWGVGPRIYTEAKESGKSETGRTMIAGRAAVGLSYLAHTVPMEFFGELALALNLIPNTFTEGSLGLGFRYYF